MGGLEADRTLAKIGAQKLKTQTVPIVVENVAVPRLMKTFVSAMYGAAIQQERSFLVGKKDALIASPAFSMINDPLLEKGNHLHFWKKLATVGNDPWALGDWRVPSLLFNDVMVAGG